MIRCPRCHSDDIICKSCESEGYNPFNACCGLCLFGPIGLICGFSSNNMEYKCFCKRCGCQF